VAYSSGFLYVADTYNSRIQKFAVHGPSLEFVTAWGDSGSGPGQFQELEDVDITPSGQIVAADSGNNRIQIFTNDGTLVLQFGGAVGPSRGRLSYPYGVAVDVHGNIYTAEPYRRRMQKFDAHGIWQFDWGSASAVKVERLTRPLHMWIDAAGLVYVCDYDDTAHADRIVVWRPADAPTAVSATTMTRLRAAYR
jgi:DNA-binding beta-propeller fold protein YncE